MSQPVDATSAAPKEEKKVAPPLPKGPPPPLPKSAPPPLPKNPPSKTAATAPSVTPAAASGERGITATPTQTTSTPASASATNETKGLSADEAPETVEGYKPPARVSLAEMMNKDADDESLQKYK
jgi:hypothetical protein